jgi:hypothetical protein
MVVLPASEASHPPKFPTGMEVQWVTPIMILNSYNLVLTLTYSLCSQGEAFQPKIHSACQGIDPFPCQEERRKRSLTVCNVIPRGSHNHNSLPEVAIHTEQEATLKSKRHSWGEAYILRRPVGQPYL